MQELPQIISLKSTISTNSFLTSMWQQAMSDPTATPSTAHGNKDLERGHSRSNSELPPFLTVVADFQNSGRGRLGREWVAPAGTSLLASILVPTKTDHFSLLPLVVGVAVSDLIRSLLPSKEIQLKWPNDVLVESKKISGILCEQLSPAWSIVGVGINLSQTADQLPPVPSTSIALEGGPLVAANLLALGLATSLQDLVDADPEELHALVEHRCSTLGQRVLVSLPAGTTLEGRALSLESDGALRIEDLTGAEQIIRAGDIAHLRMPIATRQLTSQGGRS